MRRWIIILLVLALALAGAAGFWLVARPSAAAYVVPGAMSVRVRELGLGERYITYDAPGGQYDWYFTIADRLEHAGWIPPDKWGSPEQQNTYTHVSAIWGGYGGYLWEQVELHGEPRQARITVREDGVVDVIIGTQPAGQGHQTSFAQVVADLLVVPAESVRIIMGDTDVVKAGGGTHSGRSMRHAATVFSIAAVQLIEKGKRLAAIVLGAVPGEVEFTDGRFSTRDSNRSFDFRELAQELGRHALPDDLKSGLAVVADNEMHDPVFPNGCAVCEIEVDPESGGLTLTRYVSVDDVGRCINPLIVHGQTHGAIAQGIGQALWEQCVIDEDSGQPLCGSLMDYGLPRADSLPLFRTGIMEVLSPTNPLGIKAGGEGGTTAAPAVIISAIVHALSRYGVQDLRMPATPYRVWQAIQDAKAKPA